MTMQDLKAKSDKLKQINKGGGRKGESWKDNINSNSSWKKVTEAWEQKLSQCDAQKIEDELEQLKED